MDVVSNKYRTGLRLVYSKKATVYANRYITDILFASLRKYNKPQPVYARYSLDDEQRNAYSYSKSGIDICNSFLSRTHISNSRSFPDDYVYKLLRIIAAVYFVFIIVFDVNEVTNDFKMSSSSSSSSSSSDCSSNTSYSSSDSDFSDDDMEQSPRQIKWTTPRRLDIQTKRYIPTLQETTHRDPRLQRQVPPIHSRLDPRHLFSKHRKDPIIIPTEPQVGYVNNDPRTVANTPVPTPSMERMNSE